MAHSTYINMKVGDAVYCIKGYIENTYDINGSRAGTFRFFEKDCKYKIFTIEGNWITIVESSIDEYISFHLGDVERQSGCNFYDYFKTETQIRKDKLNTIL